MREEVLRKDVIERECYPTNLEVWYLEELMYFDLLEYFDQNSSHLLLYQEVHNIAI